MNVGMHWSSQEDRFRREYAILLIIFIVLGLWFRIRHLGDLSLIGDEGIEALAVQSIIQHGVPKVDSGLIYGRWPLYLYMQAGLAYFFELEAFWLRLPSVIWGVAAIVPAYVLGKSLFNRPVGLLTTAILTFSVWEIELSRYARGYTAFQFFFLVSLICFYWGFMLDKYRYKIWFIIAAAFTLLTHALSDLLITLFVIPLFSSGFAWSRKMMFGLWGLGLGGMIVVRRKVAGLHLSENLSSLAEEGSTAGGIIDQVRRALGLPALNLPDMSYFFQIARQDSLLLTALALVAGIATIYLFYRLFQKGRGWRVLIGLLMVWAAFAYQFGLVLIFFVIYLAAFARDLRKLRDPILVAAVGAASICLISWFAILLTAYPQLNSILVMQTLFGFPDLYGYLLAWLIDGWPVMTISLVIGSCVLFARYLRDRSDPAPIFLMGALYLPALAASLFESFQVSRYFFHLYPLIVVIFSWVVFKGSSYVVNRFTFRKAIPRWLIILISIPVLLFASQDANPQYAYSVGGRTYQSKIDPHRGVVSWEFYAGFHQDLKSPSLYVKEHLTDQDKVIVTEPEHMAGIYHFYLREVDYFLAAEEGLHSDALIREKEDKQNEYIHYITGSKIISGRKELKELIQKHEGALWLLGDRRLLSENSRVYSDQMGRFLNRITKQEEYDYVGRDETTVALKIP
jgi:hypothetical protein